MIRARRPDLSPLDASGIARRDFVAMPALSAFVLPVA